MLAGFCPFEGLGGFVVFHGCPDTTLILEGLCEHSGVTCAKHPGVVAGGDCWKVKKSGVTCSFVLSLLPP